MSDEEAREQALGRYLHDQACYRDDNSAAFLAGLGCGTRDRRSHEWEHLGMADIIPAGDRGSFTITDAQLVETGATTMGAFEVLVREEARRRGLDLSVSENVQDRSITIAWRPSTQPTEQESSE